MDDIIDSINDKANALKVTKQIEDILVKGGFKMKEWIYSRDSITSHENIIPTPTEKVLGITWSPSHEEFHFKVKLNFVPKRHKRKKQQHIQSENISSSIPEQLTKRVILSQVNSIYDPLGLAGPFTICAKILVRELWIKEARLEWDEPIPEVYEHHWLKFFEHLTEMNYVKNKRKVKPDNTELEDPILVIFSDGSTEAYGTCGYVRWRLTNGKYDSQPLLSKNRSAPLKKMSVD